MSVQSNKNLSESAQVDQQSIQPFPRSQKIYVQGSRPDIRVPMREISLDVTPTDFGGEINAPVTVYDTSGPYTDPNVTIDVVPWRGPAIFHAEFARTIDLVISIGNSFKGFHRQRLYTLARGYGYGYTSVSVTCNISGTSV